MRSIFILTLFVLVTPKLFADDPVDYTRDIKPILSRHCYECHDAKKQQGGLRLDTAVELRKGGDSGDPVVPGKADKSLLIEVVEDSKIYPRMPYKRTPLKQKEIQLLATWINQGAKAPKKETVADVRDHWSFQPPKKPELPRVRQKAWVKNAIDQFILAKLEDEGLKPSAEADRVTLIRRLSLDLTGLPPTVAEVDAFVKDKSADAYEKLVDRLLASPHYGERWARHWLDVARYADTNGFTIDSPRQIWKYRDWVIDAFNKNMPFDQFVIEQYAGDMLPKATIEQKIATGFHRNTLLNQEGGIDREQFRVDFVADRVNTTGTVFLGLTFGCARCHDHKYDPISQKEYFQLFAFLNNQSEPTLSIATPELAAKREKLTKDMEDLEVELNGHLEAFVKKLEQEKKPIKENISMILRLRPDQRTNQQKATLDKTFRKKSAKLKSYFQKLDQIKKDMPKFPTTLVLSEMSKPRVTTVHIKGDFTRKGDVVKPSVPSLLHDLPKKKGDYNRLDLARWLASEKNPLIGRVTMNRLWQRYFGAGLVQTENDFGTQGSDPTHPQLLDWLAVEFVDRDWDLKAMHKLIVMSATYRQASNTRQDAEKIDPYNKLLARQNRIRLDAEIIRDNALSVSGLLSKQIGGPSVYPPQPAGIYNFTQVKRPWPTDKGKDRYRRGMYTFLQRSAPYPAMIVFDAPDGTNSCTRRVRSNTPLQALTLLNDKAFLELSAGLASRILDDGPKDAGSRMKYAFRICLARQPSDFEMDRLLRYQQLQEKVFAKSPKNAAAFLTGVTDADVKGVSPELLAERAAWTAVARVLMNLDEFITRE